MTHPLTPVSNVNRIEEKKLISSETADPRVGVKLAPQADSVVLPVAEYSTAQLAAAVTKKPIPSSTSEHKSSKGQLTQSLADGEDKLASEQNNPPESQTWTLAQASVPPAGPVDGTAVSCQDQPQPQPDKDCGDDKGIWWLQDSGAWLKVGLAGAGLMIGSLLLSKDDQTADLETGMAAGPFKASGMKLQYFGTSGLLLELSWDENGILTKDAKTGLQGEVQVHTSFVDIGNNQQVEVVTGVTVKFATYTGALLAVLVDVANDNVPVEYYDEVAGLMALEGTSLSAFTTIKTGQNTLAITPFTELALRKANIDVDSLLADSAAASAAMAQLLNNSTQTTAIKTAIEEVNILVGVDITNVLPTAMNDQAYASETDALAKLYGEKLASLSRLVPGNLDGGIERLLGTAPSVIPSLLNDALIDFNNDNDPINPTTPPGVEIQRPWINAAEGAQPVVIRGTSSDADNGSVVRISIFKNGVLLVFLKAEVLDNSWSVSLPQTLQAMGVTDGQELTIRAYIDPDYPTEVRTRYDATAPAAPQAAPDLQAAEDSGFNNSNSNSDNDTQVVQPRLNIGELPEVGATVELLVDGIVVPATFANGLLTPVSPLTEGAHRITFRYLDIVGNRSAESPALSLNVDITVPQAVVSLNSLNHDSGASTSDWITNVAGQTVSGDLTAPLNPGEILRASLDGGATWTNITAAVNDTAVNWIGVTFSQGTSTLQLQVVDAAGNEGIIVSQAFTLDTAVPLLTATNIHLSDDTGLSASDFITRQPVQAVSGQLEVNGVATGLNSGESLMGSVNGGLNWQDITTSVNGTAFSWANVSLSNGESSLRFKVVDVAGNEGEVSRQNYTLDTVAPAAPENFAWATYPNGINTGTNTVSGTIGDVPFTYTLRKLDQTALNLSSTSNMYNQGLFPTAYHVPNATSIRNDVASINQLTFDAPMSNPVLAFSSIGSPSNSVTISFPVPVEILWSTAVTVDQGTTGAATRVTGREGFMVVRLNGTVDEMRFDYLSNEAYVNFAFGAAVFDLLSAEQDTGVKSIDDITQVTRPGFQVQNKPADAVSAELLIDGRLVGATFNATDNTLTPNAALSDGVYQVSYRFMDVAGNTGAAGSVTQVTIDTRAPINTALTTFTAGVIGGTYEPGTVLSLKINGVTIAANRLLLDPTDGTWSLVPTSAELNNVTTGLLFKANSTFELVATDAAGNASTANQTVTKDVFNAPYIKEFIPADSSILANDTTGHTTLNLVFSKTVVAGTGKIKLWNASTNALVTEIDVTTSAVLIEGGKDIYVTLPGLTTGVRYYVTMDAGTFVDAAGQPYAGKSETGTAGWDFVGAQASIAPNFVAQDDIVNAAENADVVRITGKVVSSAAILEDITTGNLTVSVTVPQGAQPITATLVSYDNQTGEFVFSVPAQAWRDGNYGYTVNLQGSTGDATGVSAGYNFANLAVDLVAPTGIASSIDSIVDNAGQTQGNLFTTSLKFLESGFASPSGTPVVTDLNVTDLDLSRLSITMGGAWVEYGQPSPGTYNTASTVYNADRTSVTFWVQGRGTQAVQLQLTDTASGIELKIIGAKSGPAGLATTHDWNITATGVTTQPFVTSASGEGYGVSGLEYAMGWKLLESGYASITTGTNKVTDINVADLNLSQLEVKLGGAWMDVTGQTLGIYNTASSVYNSDHTGVTFWVQTVQRNPSNGVVHTKAVQLQLTDTVNGIQVKLMAARYVEGMSALPVDYNWNTQPSISITHVSSATDFGYGVSSLQFVGNNMSGAMLGNGLTDDDTPTLNGTLTRVLAQGEHIAIDRSDAANQTITVTGAEGLIVDGTTWAFNDGSLTDGVYTYRVFVEDAAGNRSASSQVRTITVDTAAPTAAVTGMALSQDTGVSSTDFLTNAAAQTLTGTLSAALGNGEKLMASRDGGITFIDITASVTATAFSWAGVNLIAGAGEVTFKVVDAMGNVGPVFQQTYTLDRTPPATPTVAALSAEADAEKILTGTAQLAVGDSLTVEVNGAVYQVTPNVQGVWQLNLDSAIATSGTLGAWIPGQPYEVIATVSDAAGNTTVDVSTGEVTSPKPLPTLLIQPRVTDFATFTLNKPSDEFGNVLIKETNGKFTVALGVTILDEASTFTQSVGRWNVVQGTPGRFGPLSASASKLNQQDYYWSSKWNLVESPNIPISNQSGYALSITSAASNTADAIAEFLRLNSIVAKTAVTTRILANEKFYFVLNADDIDGTGESGAVIVYVTEMPNSGLSFNANSISVIGSYIGHAASEFTALDFSRPGTISPMATVWIDDAAHALISGTLANDHLYDGSGADVIRGHGGFDEIVLTLDNQTDIVYIPDAPGFTYIKDFQTAGVRDQLDFSDFGFYRDNFQVLLGQNSYTGYDQFPRGVNVSGKILAASYMYQSAFMYYQILSQDSFGDADTIAEVKNLFTSGFLVLDNNAESILLTPTNGSFVHAFHVEDIDPSSEMNMLVTPLGFIWAGFNGLWSWTAENITERPAPQPDYISIGRLDADKSAFGAWFDANENGVHEVGEALIATTYAANFDVAAYYYSLNNVDFAAGSYTVRFVDIVLGFDTGLTLDSYGGTLDLSGAHFGADDHVIIDMHTNASDWMGQSASQALSAFSSPTASRTGSSAGEYADGISAIYDAVSSLPNTGLFGQLAAGVRPDVNGAQSSAAYGRLDAYADGQSIKVDVIKYQPPANSYNDGGIIGDAGITLVNLGVDITATNLTFMTPTYIIG